MATEHTEVIEHTEALEHMESVETVGHGEEHAAGPHISLRAEPLFTIGTFSFTNSLFVAILVSVLLMAVAGIFHRKLKLIPGKIQSVVEIMFEGLLDLMESVLGSVSKAEKYFPVVATIFFFVLVSNWLGLLPGVGSIVLSNHGSVVPFLRPPGADLNFTLAIAVTAVLAVNIFAIIALGPKMHVSKFFNFKSPIGFFVGILELISEFAKMVSFSFRLYGNVFAGEVLLVIVAFLVPYIAPLPFLFLEVFVGFIQAFVFAMLTLVFVAVATVEHEH